MKKQSRKIVDIKPLLKLQREVENVQALADKIIRKSGEDAAREMAHWPAWKVINRALEDAYAEPMTIPTRTVKAIEQDALRIKSEANAKPDVARAADAVLRELDDMRRAADDILSIPGVEADLPKVLAHAVHAGLRYGILLRKAGAPKGTGKRAWPEWAFIRAAWNDATKKERKPNRALVIDDGLSRFKASTGKDSARGWQAFLPHFKEQAIGKDSR